MSSSREEGICCGTTKSFDWDAKDTKKEKIQKVPLPSTTEAYCSNIVNPIQMLSTIIKKAIELKPDYAEAYSNRGMIYANQNLFIKAIDDFTKAIELSPESANNYFNRGLVYNALGNFNKSYPDIKKVAELGSEDAVKMLQTNTN